MNKTQDFTDELTVIECGKCGITFGITTTFHQRKLSDKKTFYCPNGHVLVLNGPSYKLKIRNLEKLIQKERASHDQELASNRDEMNHLSAQVRGQKAAKTRLKNRVKNGVCPCCNRHFKNLNNHMSNQHPDYGNEK